VRGGAGYLTDAERFHSDTAGEEYARRQEELRRKERAVEFRRHQVSEWVSEMRGERAREGYEWVTVWVSECVSVWVKDEGGMSGWIRVQVSEWVSEGVTLWCCVWVGEQSRGEPLEADRRQKGTREGEWVSECMSEPLPTTHFTLLSHLHTHSRTQEYWDGVRAEGKKDAKNHSKVAYNITTLEYNSDDKGKVQKYVDDMGECSSAVVQ
jgi:hypothetical protein